MRWNLADLVLVSGFALAALTITLLGVEHPALRLLLGLPLAVLLPGYALTAALFPHPTLPGTDRALYTLGLSLCALILSGFALNALPWGLVPKSWAVILAELTLGGCVVAFARRHLLLAMPETLPPATKDEQRAAYGLSLGQGLLVGLALIVVVGAIALAHTGAQKRPAADVLQLWMLPEGDATGVRIGINSVGPAEGEFRLQLRRDGYLIHEWPTISLKPGDRWADRLSLAGRQPGEGAFEAILYRTETPHTIFRQVTIWIEGQ
jgi:uncharacterized membrane protein